MRMHVGRIEACPLGQAADDQERPRPCERAALGVQEKVGPVPAVEVRTAAREVAADGICRVPADRDDPFLVALSEDADQPLLEVDRRELETDGLADAQAAAVEQLDERMV